MKLPSACVAVVAFDSRFGCCILYLAFDFNNKNKNKNTAAAAAAVPTTTTTTTTTAWHPIS